ncbi:MAG: hypothetical protein WC792_04200 [Candidatus Micrarchaeia archaeon]|jgi:hypothetical protein
MWARVRVWEGKKLVSDGKADAETLALRRGLSRKLSETEGAFRDISMMSRRGLKMAGMAANPPSGLGNNAFIQAEVRSRIPNLENRKILVIGGTDAEAVAWALQGAGTVHIQPDRSEVHCIRESLADAEAIRGKAEEKLGGIRGKFDAVVSKSVLQHDVVNEAQLTRIIKQSLGKSDLHVHLFSNAAPKTEAFLKEGWRVVEKTPRHGSVKLIVLERMKTR